MTVCVCVGGWNFGGGSTKLKMRAHENRRACARNSRMWVLGGVFSSENRFSPNFDHTATLKMGAVWEFPRHEKKISGWYWRVIQNIKNYKKKNKNRFEGLFDYVRNQE